MGLGGRPRSGLRLAIYLASSFVFSLGASMTTPVFPHFVLKLGLEMKLLGLIGTASSAINTALRVPVSAAMPVVGYFKVVCAGYWLVAASRALYSLADAGVYPVALFSLGYVLSAVQFGLVRATRASVVARLTAGERRGFFMGLASSLAMAAACVGPLLGAALYENYGTFTSVFYASATLALLASASLVPLTLRDIKGERGEALSLADQLRAAPAVIRRGGLGAALILFMADAFVWSLTFRYVPIYLACRLGATPSDLAVLNLVSTAVSAVGLVSAGYVSDRLRRRAPFLVISELCGVAYFSAILAASDLTLAYVAYAFMGFVISFWSPVASAYVTERAERTSRDMVPIAVGVWMLLTSLARTPGGFVGGVLYDISPRLLFGVVVAMLAALTALMALLLRD